MSLSETKYKIIGHYGDLFVMTAKQLCDRIMADSERSDYNWIAPARELVRVCKSKDFPVEYAIVIKVAILNCFSSIEHRANCGGDRYYTDSRDEKAVEYCYNSLKDVDAEDAILARKRFLNEMITRASYTRIFDLHYHPGSTYRNIRDNWKESKFEEYISKNNIDFNEMLKTLKHEFEEVITKAEKNGEFKEDEKKAEEELSEFYKKFAGL